MKNVVVQKLKREANVSRSYLMIRMSEDSFVNFLSLAQFQFIFSSVNNLNCESFNICDFNVFSFSFFCPDAASQIYVKFSCHFISRKLNSFLYC